MIRLPDDREKRLNQLKWETTQRGFDRHASILTTIAQLPAEFQLAAVRSVASTELIETIILFPPQLHRGWDYIPKQALLFTKTGVIQLLASIWPDQEPRVTYLEGCDLMYVQVKLLLLYGHLEIVVHGQTAPARLSLEFNTVAWYKLSGPLRKLLLLTRMTPNLSANETQVSPQAAQIFEKLPLKFSNGVKIYGLLPGEQLEELVFQRGVWKRWLHFFRRPITANTLLLLTSHYVVVIREELKVAQGWILTYIPRSCISEVQNRSCNMYSELIIKLRREDQKAEYKILLKSESVEAWRLKWIQHGGEWKDLSVPGEMK